jgi:hypothetical protein
VAATAAEQAWQPEPAQTEPGEEAHVPGLEQAPRAEERPGALEPELVRVAELKPVLAPRPRSLREPVQALVLAPGPLQPESAPERPRASAKVREMVEEEGAVLEQSPP